MELFLLGFVSSSFVAPFLSEMAKILAKRLFGEKAKTLPDAPENVSVVVFFVNL